MYIIIFIINCCVLYMKIFKRVNSKSFHHKEKYFFSLLFFIYEVKDIQ